MKFVFGGRVPSIGNTYEKVSKAESLVDHFVTQNSEFFLGKKIIIFLDFDLKFLSFSGCPRKVRNLVLFAGVSKSSRRPIYFRDKYSPSN